MGRRGERFGASVDRAREAGIAVDVLGDPALGLLPAHRRTCRALRFDLTRRRACRTVFPKA